MGSGGGKREGRGERREENKPGQQTYLLHPYTLLILGRSWHLRNSPLLLGGAPAWGGKKEKGDGLGRSKIIFLFLSPLSILFFAHLLYILQNSQNRQASQWHLLKNKNKQKNKKLISSYFYCGNKPGALSKAFFSES
jgi:hypothetical protein